MTVVIRVIVTDGDEYCLYFNTYAPQLGKALLSFLNAIPIFGFCVKNNKMASGIKQNKYIKILKIKTLFFSCLFDKDKFKLVFYTQ